MLFVRSTPTTMACSRNGHSRSVDRRATRSACVGALAWTSIGTTAGASKSSTSRPASSSGPSISLRVRRGSDQKSASFSFNGPVLTLLLPSSLVAGRWPACSGGCAAHDASAATNNSQPMEPR